MRLAEFKMRLLVFCAARLLQWAGKSETNREDEPPSDAASEDAQWFEYRLDEVAETSEPPEHWTRLITTPPPQPWLDLLRKKAPQLLASLHEDVPTLTRENSAANEPHESQQFRLPLEMVVADRTRLNPTNYSVKTQARTWLNRLRFASPRLESANDETTYVRAENGPESQVDYVDYMETDRATARAHDSLSFPAPPVRPLLTFKTAVDGKGKQPDRRSLHVEVSETLPTYETHEFAPEFPSSSSRGVPPNPSAYVPADPPRTSESVYTGSSREIPHTELRLFSPTSTKSRSELKFSDLTPGKALRASDTSAETARQAKAREEHESFNSNVSKRRIQTSAFLIQPRRSEGEDRTHYLALSRSTHVPPRCQPREGRIEFPTTELDETAARESNVWPTLPVDYQFQLSDEVAMREAESEAVRRLEDEQRGV